MCGEFLDFTGLSKLVTWIKNKLSMKLDVLVSGKNIKTINGKTVLGSGNITIEGGGSVTINDIEAEAEAEETSVVSADVTIQDNKMKFSFGIPRGAKGDTGAAGKDGADGKDGTDGKDGADGTTPIVSRQVNIYRVQDELPDTPSKSEGYWDVSTGDFTCPSGWSLTYSMDETDAVWMSQTMFTSTTGAAIFAWSTPVKVKGQDGKNGTDGEDGSIYEYIYLRTEDSTQKPDTPESKNVGDYCPTDATYGDWLDHPSGVNEDLQCEWVSFRVYNLETSTWGDFSEPVIWSMWGKDGKDGDGIEYIYLRTTTADAPDTPVCDITSTEFLTKEYIPNPDQNGNTWTDDPTGVDADNRWEWVCTRKYDQGTGKWGAFKGSSANHSKAALWSHYGEDGIDGSSNSYKQVFVFADSESKPTTPTGGAYNFITDKLTELPTDPNNLVSWLEQLDDPTYYVWMSTATFSEKDGLIGDWSTPVRVGNADDEAHATSSSFSVSQTNPAMVLVKKEDEEGNITITGEKSTKITVARATTDTSGNLSMSEATITNLVLDNGETVATGLTASVSSDFTTITVTTTSDVVIGAYNIPFTITVKYQETEGTNQNVTQNLHGAVSVAVLAGQTVQDTSGELYVIVVSPTSLVIPWVLNDKSSTSDTLVYDPDLDDAISYVYIYKGTELQTTGFTITVPNQVKITNGTTTTLTGKVNCNALENYNVPTGAEYSGWVAITELDTLTIQNGGYNSSGNTVNIQCPAASGRYDVVITVGDIKYTATVNFTTDSTNFSKTLIDNAIVFVLTYDEKIQTVNNDLTASIKDCLSSILQNAESITSTAQELNTKYDELTSNVSDVTERVTTVEETASGLTTTVSNIETDVTNAVTKGLTNRVVITADGITITNKNTDDLYAGEINFNNNFVVDGEGNVTVSSITATLPSFTTSGDEITPGDLAYKFTNSNGEIVAGFFSYGNGCQLAIKDSDGTWRVLNFANLTEWSKKIAAAFSRVNTYYIWSDSATLTSKYQSATLTLNILLPKCSSANGYSSLYMYQKNDTGSADYNYKWYDSSSFLGNDGTTPKGTAATGVYLYNYTEYSGSTVIDGEVCNKKYAEFHIFESGTWTYSVNLTYYISADKIMPLYSVTTDSIIRDHTNKKSYKLSTDNTKLGEVTMSELVSSPSSYKFETFESAKSSTNSWEDAE